MITPDAQGHCVIRQWALSVLTRGQHCLVKSLSLHGSLGASQHLSLYLCRSVCPSDPSGPLNRTEYPAGPCNPHNSVISIKSCDRWKYTHKHAHVHKHIHNLWSPSISQSYISFSEVSGTKAVCFGGSVSFFSCSLFELCCVPVAGLHVSQLADVEGLRNIKQLDVEQVIVSCTPVVVVCSSLW